MEKMNAWLTNLTPKLCFNPEIVKLKSLARWNRHNKYNWFNSHVFWTI